MNGLLVVNKPAGITSHDVVNAVRRMAKTRRVGHAGTLDPLATGVLVLLVGPATRLAQFISGSDKTYRATIRLGQATTTYDADGDIVAQYPVAAGRADVEQALNQFRGPIAQVPPMYSAIKVNGQKLYKLARQGRDIARQPRDVTIHRLDIVAWTPPDFIVDVICSAGTYVRSLAHDLGQTLGCGAHLTALSRTASGDFTLAQSHTLDDLRALADDGRFASALLAPQTALAAFPSVTLTTEQERAVDFGQKFTLYVPAGAEMAQALDSNGYLRAVLIPVSPDVWRPKLVFPKIEA